jgi:hypothetical protein
MNNAGVETGNIVTLYSVVAKAVNLFQNTAKFSGFRWERFRRKTGNYSVLRFTCQMNSYNKSQPDAQISQIYFWNRTLHVSYRSTVHHQESSTVHTAIGICHTGYADCLLCSVLISLADSTTCMTYTYCCVYSIRLLMMDNKPVRNM